MFTELHREEEREEGDKGGPEYKRGEWKGERQIQPVVSSLRVLHHLEYTEIHRENREEKGEGGDRGDLVEKKESPKEERAVRPVISLSSISGYWRLGFWRYKIDNKYQIAKIKNLE